MYFITRNLLILFQKFNLYVKLYLSIFFKIKRKTIMAKESIAFLGLGIMGQGIVANLLKANYPITVYNRTVKKAEPFVSSGAKLALTPYEAVKGADFVMIMVNDDSGINDVIFKENGILKGVKPGQIVMDLTTCSPNTSRCEAEAFEKKGVDFLDTPVFGSKGEARDATLVIVVGGKRETFEKALPLMKTISVKQHYMGENGKGSIMKLVGNLIAAAEWTALGESMTLAAKNGLNPENVIAVLDDTRMRSPLISASGKALCQRDFTPAFYLKLLLKDENLISMLAQESGVSLPVSAVIREIIKTGVNAGWGEENASALIKVIERMAGIETKKD
jgi:3-hydroxyisobutyrate dehydrogenase-like beta-hydroxyacid dehydrogenase